MQLETLKIFCDVVRWSSFSRGAAENDISQSTASQAVHQLEQRLGVKLIDRSKRPLVPTPHGRVYYEGCKDLVTQYLELEARVRTLEDVQNLVGTVRVASIYSVGLAHLTAYAERFRSMHPCAEVRLDYLHPKRVLESVSAGLSDLGLISFPKKWPDLTVIPWQNEEMVVVVTPRHRLASLAMVEVKDLEGEALVTFNPDLAIRRAIDSYLRRHGLQLDALLEFDNIENIKRAVIELPAGVAILPRPTLERELKAGTLVALSFVDQKLRRPLAIIHRSAGGLSLTATRFLELLATKAGTAAPAPEPKPAVASQAP